MKEHNGTGEDVVFVDITANEDGKCAVGLHNPGLGIAVGLRFNKEQLPWFTNWQHWGSGEYVTGLEPGVSRPYGQAKARARNELVFLNPGEKRVYDLELEVLTGKEEIIEFERLNG